MRDWLMSLGYGTIPPLGVAQLAYFARGVAKIAPRQPRMEFALHYSGQPPIRCTHNRG